MKTRRKIFLLPLLLALLFSCSFSCSHYKGMRVVDLDDIAAFENAIRNSKADSSLTGSWETVNKEGDPQAMNAAANQMSARAGNGTYQGFSSQESMEDGLGGKTTDVDGRFRRGYEEGRREGEKILRRR